MMTKSRGLARVRRQRESTQNLCSPVRSSDPFAPFQTERALEPKPFLESPSEHSYGDDLRQIKDAVANVETTDLRTMFEKIKTKNQQFIFNTPPPHNRCAR